VSEPINAIRYIGYIASRWRWILASCGIALAAAFALGMAMPREYTATARIVIDPPAGGDTRASTTAVSPIYLESLKTYEAFASSDSLFQKAIDRFGLRASLGARPIESLKKSILKAGLVRNTRILEISATLPDARKAQAVAQFVAESTAALSRSLASESDVDLTRGVEGQEAQARAGLAGVDARWARLQAAEPVGELQASIEASSKTRARLFDELLGAQEELAGAAAREKRAEPGELAQIQSEENETQAHVVELRREIEALDKQSAAREQLLGARMAHRDQLDAERKAAQAAYATIESRLTEARGSAGYRAERLEIIDPGVVPERPSSPNMPLYLFAALLLGIALPVFYFAVEINFREAGFQDETPRSRRVVHSLMRGE
jgi:uncharacterized protein involved in exopolysaccharide biosynthesis